MFDKAQVLKLVDNDKELYLSIIEIFKNEWPELVHIIEFSLEKKSYFEAEKAAHKLKGSLKNFYADECVEQAQELELACHEEEQEHALKQLEALKPLCEKLEKALALSADEI